jgi:hypothetical protein
MEHWTETQINEFHSLESLLTNREDDYENCSEILAQEVEKNSKKGGNSKIILIVLGALVAIKGVIDQLMVEYKNATVEHGVLIIFTLIGVIISIIAGLDSTFKYAEIAGGLRILSAQAQSNILMSQTNRAISYHLDDYQEAISALKDAINEQVKQLKSLYDQAAFFGLDLAAKANQLRKSQKTQGGNS